MKWKVFFAKKRTHFLKYVLTFFPDRRYNNHITLLVVVFAKEYVFVSNPFFTTGTVVADLLSKETFLFIANPNTMGSVARNSAISRVNKIFFIL